MCLSWHADRAAAEAVAAEIGGRAVRADAAAEADVVALFAAADELDRVTATVANAGIVAPQARLDEIGADRMRRMLEVNVLGVMLTAREAVRRMSTRHGGQGGSIVTVSSAASRLGSPGEYVDYAASKGAVDTFTLGLAREVATEGIRVNAVRPGIVDTDIHASGGQPDRAARLAAIDPGGAARPRRGGGRRDRLAARRRVPLHHRRHPGRQRGSLSLAPLRAGSTVTQPPHHRQTAAALPPRTRSRSLSSSPAPSRARRYRLIPSSGKSVPSSRRSAPTSVTTSRMALGR